MRLLLFFFFFFKEKYFGFCYDRYTFKLHGGFVDRVTDWCVTGPGFVPRRVQL